MGVKGVRIDAAKHQDAGEMYGYIKQFRPGFYVAQEVIGSSGEAVLPSMYYGNGKVSEFSFSPFLCDNVVPENKMIYLKTIGESWGLMPDTYSCIFIDNHDTQRNGQAHLTYKNGGLYTFANIFMLAWPYGEKRVMSSYYFSNTDAGPPGVGVNGGANCMNNKDWVCEHRWGPIGNMVRWNIAAGTADIANWQQGSNNQIAFSRGGRAFIALNRDSNNYWSVTLQTGLPAGSYCQIIGSDTADNVSTCSTITVGSSGQASFSVPPVSAQAIHVLAKK